MTVTTPDYLAKKLAEKLFGSVVEATCMVDISRAIHEAWSEGYKEAVEIEAKL